jgi:hypothetical protein
MPERDPIELIKEQLHAAEGVAGLGPEHESFKQWHSETRATLEKAFSPQSVHYQSFLALRFREISVKSFASPEIDKINAARYKRDLESAKNILHGAMKELMLDRTLFKKISTSPRTVDVSFRGEAFLSLGSSDPELVQTVEQAFEGSGMDLSRSDEAFRKDTSWSQRVEKIRYAKFGIFILSDPDKPDILIELGIALGMGKDVWVFCRKGAFPPEFLQHLNPIEYEDLSGLAEALRKRRKNSK